MTEDRRCGNCKSWSRGGIGAGRGGGYCMRWGIVKHPQNRHHADGCWEPKSVRRSSLKETEK